MCAGLQQRDRFDDRMSVALVIALVLHALVLLGLSFMLEFNPVKQAAETAGRCAGELSHGNANRMRPSFSRRYRRRVAVIDETAEKPSAGIQPRDSQHRPRAICPWPASLACTYRDRRRNAREVVTTETMRPTWPIANAGSSSPTGNAQRHRAACSNAWTWPVCSRNPIAPIPGNRNFRGAGLFPPIPGVRISPPTWPPGLPRSNGLAI